MVACIVPSDSNKAILVPVGYTANLGSVGVWLEYTHRKFLLDTEDMEDDDDYSNATWSKISPPKHIPLTHLKTWQERGHSSETHAQAVHMFGPNTCKIHTPTFLEMYKEQLLSPFCIFQLFCTLLWTLDAYVTYSLFTLGMILVFEATVVFSRLKSVTALSTTGNNGNTITIPTLRDGAYMDVNIDTLVPGDVCLLSAHYKGDGVPADCVVLSGECVVNEASLTGESVPQHKEGIIFMEDVMLNKEEHKNALLFAGTKLMQVSSNEEEQDIDVLGNSTMFMKVYILRTGFTHAGGKMVRMMQQSTAKTSNNKNNKEVGYLLLLLLLFAVMSSAYVLQNGMKILVEQGIADHKVHYNLLLHCILILTSVIPPELPMQMSLTVNTSMASLMKLAIFCTDPNKVPVSGCVDVALFDKTGTLTTDELVAVKCVDPKHGSRTMLQLQGWAKLVVAGCHGVFCMGDVDDNMEKAEESADKKGDENQSSSNPHLAGDPLEMAALSSVRWTVQSSGDVTLNSNPKNLGTPIQLQSKQAITKFKVTHRHPFSSKLGRMTTLAHCSETKTTYALTKGSPEAVFAHCLGSATSDAKFQTWYDTTVAELAGEGYRVIALCAKTWDENDSKEDRGACERDSVFCGFVAFTCRVRKDTKQVLSNLTNGATRAIMVTGDAPLTAIHVAHQVAMTPHKDTLLLSHDPNTNTATWSNTSATSQEVIPFDPSTFKDLTKKYTLAVTGKSFNAMIEDLAPFVYDITIYARCKPKDKELLVKKLAILGHTSVMCGDGANDVGALRGADVGVALLSGFGNVNVEKDEAASTTSGKDANLSTAMITQDEYNQLKKLSIKEIKGKLRGVGVNPDDPKLKEVLLTKDDLLQLYRKKSAERAVVKHLNQPKNKKKTKEELRAEQQIKMQEKQAKIQKRIAELEAQGVSWASFKAMKEFMNEEMTEKKKLQAKYKGVEGSAAHFVQQMEDLDMNDVPQIKIGDASMAAPFTSKMPSIRSVTDIVRQGRCTLVTTFQMYQILALNSLISAYSLSVLYLDGIKYGDVQMTGMGILMSITYMSVSRSKPLNQLSPVRPLTSIFHPSLFCSLLLQFVVHLSTMIYAITQAKAYRDDDHVVDLDGEFKPSLLNSVVFLVSCVQQVAVFVVNLQGRPFMTGLTENRPLLWSLIATFVLVFMFASESVPSLNKYMQLVPFPDEDFRNFILTILAADVISCLVLDRLMKLIFAPKILWASMQGTTAKDVMAIARTIGIILAVIYMLVGDNEQWEELMREEGRLDELGENVTDAVADVVADVVAETVVGAGEL
uniref:P-type ATPase A domain-containing protein n=1 Tax=Leptocylindrus danicus TaxID=163516 RepID=A0A7S2NT13_9STRA